MENKNSKLAGKKRRFHELENEIEAFGDINNHLKDPPNKRNPIIQPKKKKRDSDDEDIPPTITFILFDGDENYNNINGNNYNDKNKKDLKKEIKTGCPNPLCNHKSLEEDSTQIEKLSLTEIKDIEDLIKLGKSYHCKKNNKHNNIDLAILCKLVNPLSELSKMVGMKSVKENMVNQILFFLQGLNKTESKDGFGKVTINEDMLHTVITGPPGVGKTELGKILGKVYKEMGVLSKGSFRLVTRADLIAKYLGQTAIKTQDVIDDCQGGVMFIDEAYALGHSEGRDSFSKECLDTLNQNLTEKRDFLCIIAGYKEALEECFFKMNEGLRRRFTFRYDIEEYTPEELKEIFVGKLNKENWKLEFNGEEEQMKKFINFFKDNKGNFPNFGGDMETLFLNCKICHSRRVVLDTTAKLKELNLDDIQKGFANFLKNRKNKSKDKLSLYG